MDPDPQASRRKFFSINARKLLNNASLFNSLNVNWPKAPLFLTFEQSFVCFTTIKKLFMSFYFYTLLSWFWIRIFQAAGSGSEFRITAGSAKNECGSRSKEKLRVRIVYEYAEKRFSKFEIKYCENKKVCETVLVFKRSRKSYNYFYSL